MNIHFILIDGLMLEYKIQLFEQYEYLLEFSRDNFETLNSMFTSNNIAVGLCYHASIFIRKISAKLKLLGELYRYKILKVRSITVLYRYAYQQYCELYKRWRELAGYMVEMPIVYRKFLVKSGGSSALQRGLTELIKRMSGVKWTCPMSDWKFSDMYRKIPMRLCGMSARANDFALRYCALSVKYGHESNVYCGLSMTYRKLFVLYWRSAASV